MGGGKQKTTAVPTHLLQELALSSHSALGPVKGGGEKGEKENKGKNMGWGLVSVGRGLVSAGCRAGLARTALGTPALVSALPALS